MGENAIKPILMPTYHTMKKSYYYNFLLTKAEEEMVASIPWARNGSHDPARILVKIRDVHPRPAPAVHHPWTLFKKILENEANFGTFLFTHRNMFEHVLRHWPMIYAEKISVLRQSISVMVYDVTDDERNPKMYVGSDVYIVMSPDRDFVLACGRLMTERNLKDGDCVCFYWDENECVFKFKLLFRNLKRARD